MTTNQPPYQFAVDLTLKDIEYFFYYQKTKGVFIKLLFFLLGSFLIYLSSMSIYLFITTQNTSVLQTLTVPIIFLVFIFLPIKLQARSLYNSSNGQLKNNHYTFTETSIIIENKNSQSNFTWDNIYQLEENKHQFLLYINKMMAHIIPKSCFESQQEGELFLQFLKRKVRNQG